MNSEECNCIGDEAWKRFDDADDLVKRRFYCRDMLADFNGGAYFRLYGLIHAVQAYVAAPFRYEYSCNVYMAPRSYDNMDCYFDDSAPVSIGENVLISPRVKILTPLSSGAAVCEHVPPYILVGGKPAQVIKFLNVS